MDFEKFRELKGWSLERAANELAVPGHPALCNVNASLVAKHERGIYFPNPELISRYEAITEGAVVWSDWKRIRERGVAPPRSRGRKRKVQLEVTA